MIELNGGKNQSGVSANTDFIVAGENMGPAKLQKATKLGVTILSESEFIEMIGATNRDVPTPPAQKVAEVANSSEGEAIQGSLF